MWIRSWTMLSKSMAHSSHIRTGGALIFLWQWNQMEKKRILNPNLIRLLKCVISRTVLRCHEVLHNVGEVSFSFRDRLAAIATHCVRGKLPSSHRLVPDEWYQPDRTDSMCGNRCAFPLNCVSLSTNWKCEGQKDWRLIRGFSLFFFFILDMEKQWSIYSRVSSLIFIIMDTLFSAEMRSFLAWPLIRCNNVSKQ